jgi:hypothetical protein
LHRYGSQEASVPFGKRTVTASLQIADAVAHFCVVVSHTEPCEHSELLEQDVRHWPLAASQPYGAHGIVFCAAH